MIVAPKIIRPSQIYQIHTSILHLEKPHIKVRVSLRKDRVEYGMAEETFYRPRSTLMQIEVMYDFSNVCMYIY